MVETLCRSAGIELSPMALSCRASVGKMLWQYYDYMWLDSNHKASIVPKFNKLMCETLPNTYCVLYIAHTKCIRATHPFYGFVF